MPHDSKSNELFAPQRLPERPFRSRFAGGVAALAAALLSVLAFGLSSAQAASEVDPVLWLEHHRAFFQDGAQLLLDSDQRAEFLALGEMEREAFIEAFLAEDPIPETPENELERGIERRSRQALLEYLTPWDARAQLTFLHGPPNERKLLDCGSVYQPLEIWTYLPTDLTSVAGTPWLDVPLWNGVVKLVLYQPNPDRPYRLWTPIDDKRALYTEDMIYLQTQWEEFGGPRVAKSFDIQLCDGARQVDFATGVASLARFNKGRPDAEDLRGFLEPPRDLAVWARRAAQVPEGAKDELRVQAVETAFPRIKGQRMISRLTILLPDDLALEPVPGSDPPKLDLVVESVMEQRGRIFEHKRIRFQPAPPGGKPLALVVERPLRPGRNFLARLRVHDQVSGRQTVVTQGFYVPHEPSTEEVVPVPDAVIVELGEELSERRIAGRDSLILVPPRNEVNLGLLRTEALVTGARIVRVEFFVDGNRQLARTKLPFTAEVRLSQHPIEQVLRAEGFDEDGELVAYDELILNQPRGAFKVTLLEPKRGFNGSGRVRVRAEVTLPDNQVVEQLVLEINDEEVATLTQPPWITHIEVPLQGGVTYLTATAKLEDGRTTEAVRFLNSPAYLEEVQVTLTELYTTVTDRSNRPVTGLAREEFTVFDGGKEQEITKFEYVDNLPLTVGVVIDTSGSMASSLIEAQAAANGFLETVMKPRDQCFVMSFANEPLILMPPTDDSIACRQSLTELQAAGSTTLHDAIVNSLFYFRAFEGQRAMVLLSDGNDTLSATPFRSAVEYARRSGVAIYTIGLEVSGLDFEIKGKLKSLAEETGGRSFFVSSAASLVDVYRQIEEELRSRYFLAYTPEASEEEFREVQVKVKRNGMKARTVRGYYP